MMIRRDICVYNSILGTLAAVDGIKRFWLTASQFGAVQTQ